MANAKDKLLDNLCVIYHSTLKREGLLAKKVDELPTAIPIPGYDKKPIE